MSNTIAHNANRRVDTESASLDQMTLASPSPAQTHEQVHDLDLTLPPQKDLQETNFSRNGHRGTAARSASPATSPAAETSIKTGTRHHVLPGIGAKEKHEEVIDLKNCRGPAVPGLKSLAWKQYHGTVLDKFISYLADVIKLLELRLLGRLYARREMKVNLKRPPKVVKPAKEEKEAESAPMNAGLPVKVKRRRKGSKSQEPFSLDTSSTK